MTDYQYNADFRDFIAALSDEGVAYLIVGGYAFARHVKPRVTKDFDIWVEASAENAPKIWRALARFGAPSDRFSESDFLAPGITLQIGIEPNRIDVITKISGISFQKAWANREAGDFGGLRAWYIGAPDLLKNKLAAGRPRDLVDAEALSKAGFTPSEE